ncbi:MAG: LPS assembly protein LptD [Acidobacteriota bacterium]
MRGRLWLCLLAMVALPAAAQFNPIPWHPKPVPPPASAKAKSARPATPAAPPKFHMTFDKVTTVAPGVYLAEGNVKFTYQDMLLTADSVTYDTNKGTLWATGRVAVDFQDFTASGSELTYDLNTGKGTLMDAYGVQKDGDFTVYGKEIRKIGEGWFEVIDGTFTSCAAAVPPWSMRVSHAKFHVDHYAFLTNPRFHVRQAPALYLPYLIWPIKPARSTGLLIPEIGSSSNQGFTVNNAFFIAPSDWWDDTVYVDHYSREGWGLGEEFRYVPSTDTYGWFHGYYIRQNSDGQKRWDFSWAHMQNFRHGWYFMANINLLSDINFFRDYQRDYTLSTLSGLDSSLYLVRNWGPYSLTFKAERQNQYFTEGQDLVQRTQPGVEWRSSLHPLVGDLYWGFETSADLFHKEWAQYTPATQKFSVSYNRLDVHPYFELPLHPALWLDITPRLELRATHYSESQDPSTQQYNAGQLWRSYARFSVDVVGPRFYRRYKNSIKHVIEPYVTYSYVSPDAHALRAPIFDEVDQVGLNVSQVEYGVRNRVYGPKGDLRLDSSLYQDYSFKSDLLTSGTRHSRKGPVTLLVRLWPTASWSYDLRLRYNSLTRAMDGQSLSVTYRPRKKESDDFIRLTYLKSGTLGVSQITDLTQNPLSKEIRLASALTLADGKVSINPSLERDLKKKAWRDRHLTFWYHGSCFSLGFEAGKRTIGTFTDSEYRFLVSLKGVGTVVDLWGGTGTY